MRRGLRVAVLAATAMVGSSCAALGFSTPCNGTEVIANFEEVGDLVVAGNVQSSDVGVGTVQEIELDGWEARVTMCLSPDENISADVRAVIRTTSLLGEKFVDLQVQSEGPPFLKDGAVLSVEDTGKATELEDVFAKLAAILGTGNLEQLNRFTSSQAKILEDHAGDLRVVLRELRKFTDVLAARRHEIGAAIDSLDSVARTALADADVLEEFLDSFAGASGTLERQKEALQDLVVTLDEFTALSIRLLDETEGGLNRQFEDLRPILRAAVRRSDDLRLGLQTLATFAEWWPESMPGDYLQLDVCQPGPDEFGQGVTCPQSDGGSPAGAAGDASSPRPRATSQSALLLILRRPLEGDRR